MLWFTYDLIISKEIVNKIEQNKLIGYQFFVYLFFEPFYGFIKYYASIIYEKEDLTIQISLYFFLFFFVLLSLSYLGFLFNKHIPTMYKVITGNR